jgi:hypothetical protein
MQLSLSHHWHKIQTFLFPSLEEEPGHNIRLLAN